MVKLRDVTLNGKLGTTLKTKDELADYTRGVFRRDYLRKQIFETEELYKVLGFMEESDDLEDILVGIQLQQVTAVFDDASEQVFVVSDATKVGPVEELGVATAFMASIQQQLFDTSDLRRRAREAGGDQVRALDAFIVGEVAQIATAYMSTFSKDEIDVLRQPIPENKLLAAPEIVRKANRFQRQEGVSFVAAMFGNGEWETVNSTYGDPTVSTEQIMHPEKYIDGEKHQRTQYHPQAGSRLARGKPGLDGRIHPEELPGTASRREPGRRRRGRLGRRRLFSDDRPRGPAATALADKVGRLRG